MSDDNGEQFEDKGSIVTGPVNVSVIYYSATGTVTELARTLADEAEKAGAEVRLRKVAELAPNDANPAWRANRDATQDIPEAVPDDVLWADAVLFGTPTRWGNISAQLKHFIESMAGPGLRGELQDKAYSGFTASSSLHGGQESTLLALYNTVHHIGGIVVAPGYTDPAKFIDGNPYGTSHVTARGTYPVDDIARAAAAVQAKRLVAVARALRDGLSRY